ncbi:MAG: Holliday junction branch migration protein RuvA [Lachnospiraceae bacterium]|nr:Holliday junction branch migration protein RuvA [Lachnospiraceae bacterium]
MIGFVSGTVENIGEKEILINNNGIGYNIIVPDSVVGYIGSTGKEVKIYTYLSVREDAMQLFGFLKQDELELFKMLIKVSGIGPKGAISLLSVMTADDLRFAIIAGDSKAISKAPGIGAKTAGKVVLELRDKVEIDTGIDNENDDNGVGSSQISGDASGDIQKIRNETMLALEALGFSPTDAMKAVKKVNITGDMTSEDVLKQALKNV